MNTTTIVTPWAVWIPIKACPCGLVSLLVYNKSHKQYLGGFIHCLFGLEACQEGKPCRQECLCRPQLAQEQLCSQLGTSFQNQVWELENGMWLYKGRNSSIHPHSPQTDLPHLQWGNGTSGPEGATCRQASAPGPVIFKIKHCLDVMNFVCFCPTSAHCRLHWVT